jgi:hypothetical protein
MTTLSDSTIQQYITNLTTIAREVGADSSKKNWISDNWMNIKTYLDSIENLHTRKSKMCAVLFSDQLHALPATITFYLRRNIQLLINAINERYAMNVKNEKQQGNWVELFEVEERIEELEQEITTEITYENYKNILRYLILLFHRHVPLRNDLARTKIVYDRTSDFVCEPEINYILLDQKVLLLNHYKTIKTYGAKTVSLIPVVTDAIELYLPILQHFSPHGWFFARMNGQQHTAVQFSKLFNSIWKDEGKNVGSTQIRRTVVSDLYNVDEGEMKKKQELADVMCHSVNTASLIYAKAKN